MHYNMRKLYIDLVKRARVPKTSQDPWYLSLKRLWRVWVNSWRSEIKHGADMIGFHVVLHTCATQGHSRALRCMLTHNWRLMQQWLSLYARFAQLIVSKNCRGSLICQDDIWKEWECWKRYASVSGFSTQMMQNDEDHVCMFLHATSCKDCMHAHFHH